MGKRQAVQVVLLEDERPVRILLERELISGGSVGVELEDGREILDQLSSGGFDVLRADLEPGTAEDGSEALRVVRSSGDGAEAIVVMRGGHDDSGPVSDWLGDAAHDFLTRPLSPSLVRDLTATEVPASPSRRPLDGVPGAAAIVGSSPGIIEVLAKAERIAASNAAVLVQGETGTGKTLVARVIHAASHRRAKPFVVVNCSAFQDQLLESELFGHERGSFTGAVAAKAGLIEVADGGTLFLDEVAEMSPAMQAKLLQVLDTGELRRVGGTRQRQVSTRIISASNKDLEAEVKAGRFREDLFFRLKVVTLAVPPLRERAADIPLLVEVFLRRFRGVDGKPKGLAPAALRLLIEHAWPGNVRELANLIEGLVLLTAGPMIEAADLPPSLRPAAPFTLDEAETPLPMSEIERLHIKRTLAYTAGRKAQAARLLGIDVKTLNSKIRNYGLEV